MKALIVCIVYFRVQSLLHTVQPVLCSTSEYMVPVEHAKVGESDGQLVVRLRLLVEHEAVAGAVHRLERKLLLLHLEPADYYLLIIVLKNAA